MREKIIQLFNQSRLQKITFKPAIRIKIAPNSEPVWIDSMSRVRDQHVVNISNRRDKAFRNVNALTESELDYLHTRLNSLYGHRN